MPNKVDQQDKAKGQVEWETLQWVDWFNKEHLLEPLGYIAQTEAE